MNRRDRRESVVVNAQMTNAGATCQVALAPNQPGYCEISGKGKFSASIHVFTVGLATEAVVPATKK